MIQKTEPVRSRKLRESARDQPCTMRLPGYCDSGGETTVLAHAPFGGRGMARKGDDSHAIYACARCHDVLDGRVKAEEVPREELWECVIRGLAETHEIMRARGLVKWT